MVPTSLRRRGQLVSIEVTVTSSNSTLQQLANEDATDNDDNTDNDTGTTSNPFGHYVSPCEFRVSNDPLLVSEQESCDKTIYGCVRDHTFLLETQDDVKELVLHYDYDMYYQFDSEMHNFPDMVEFLEGTMLEHLASLLELKQCPPESASTNTGRGGLHQRRQIMSDNNNRALQGFSENEKSVVIAINSEPGDVVSPDYECIVPPDNGITCKPMMGFVTIYVEEQRVPYTDESYIENAALKAIQSGMHANVYVKGAIKSLVFIGERDAPLVQAEDQETDLETGGPIGPAEFSIVAATETEDPNGGSSLGGPQVGMISAAAAFVILVAILGLFVSSRRRKVESTNQSFVKAQLDDDEDGALEGIDEHSKRRRKATIVVNRQWSLEGAEIPGSLAARDALALKPQFPRPPESNNEGKEKSLSDSETSIPQTPPRISRTTPQSSVNALNIATPEREEVQMQEKRPSIRRFEIPKLALSAVPYSPVRNQNSGISPSKVSPQRLPAPLNVPYVAASHQQSSTNSQQQQRYPVTTDIDSLIATFETRSGGSSLSPRPTSSGRSDTFKTLEKIAYTGSGDSSASFQDSSTDESRLATVSTQLSSTG